MFPPNVGRSAYSKEQELRKEASAHDDVSSPQPDRQYSHIPSPLPSYQIILERSTRASTSSNLLFSRYSSGQAK